MSGPAARHGVRVGVLGPVQLTVDGAAVHPGGARQRTVLAVLAVEHGTSVSADRLADAVWSGAARAGSRTTLHVHVHNVRALLGPYGPLLSHGSAGYRLDCVDVDTALAEARISRARDCHRFGDHPAAVAAYRSALACWRGELCSDLPEVGYLDPLRARYETLRLTVLEECIEAELRLGGQGVVAELEELVAQHPLRERLWGQLMVALYRNDQQSDALAAYRRARAALADEAGLDPGTALHRLERAILARAGTTEVLRVAGAGTPTAPRAHPSILWVDDRGRPRQRELAPVGPLVIGRDADTDVPLTWDSAVSRRHAALDVAGGRVRVTDLGSTNGTWHNGVLLPGSVAYQRSSPGAATAGQPLRSGDLIRCGDTLLAVRGPGAALGAARSGHPTLPADPRTIIV